MLISHEVMSNPDGAIGSNQAGKWARPLPRDDGPQPLAHYRACSRETVFQAGRFVQSLCWQAFRTGAAAALLSKKSRA